MIGDRIMFRTSVFGALLLFSAAPAMFADPKHPNQAGNDNIDLTGIVILDPALVDKALDGTELGAGYVVVRVSAKPKTGREMRIGPSDFTLISRKNGDRADAATPEIITTTSSLVVRRDTAGRDYGSIRNEPGFTGVAGIQREKQQGGVDKEARAAHRDALESKMLPDVNTKDRIEGLVYFSLDARKLKAKDLAMTYSGPGGHLTIDFK